MPMLDEPEMLPMEVERAPKEKDAYNGVAGRRWRPIFQNVKDKSLEHGLPAPAFVVYKSDNQKVAQATSSRIRKEAWRFLVPGVWRIQVRSVFNADGNFVDCRIEAFFLKLPDEDEPDKVTLLPGRRGPIAE